VAGGPTALLGGRPAPSTHAARRRRPATGGRASAARGSARRAAAPLGFALWAAVLLVLGAGG